MTPEALQLLLLPYHACPLPLVTQTPEALQAVAGAVLGYVAKGVLKFNVQQVLPLKEAAQVQ